MSACFSWFAESCRNHEPLVTRRGKSAKIQPEHGLQTARESPIVNMRDLNPKHGMVAAPASEGWPPMSGRTVPRGIFVPEGTCEAEAASEAPTELGIASLASELTRHWRPGQCGLGHSCRDERPMSSASGTSVPRRFGFLGESYRRPRDRLRPRNDAPPTHLFKDFSEAARQLSRRRTTVHHRALLRVAH